MSVLIMKNGKLIIIIELVDRKKMDRRDEG